MPRKNSVILTNLKLKYSLLNDREKDRLKIGFVRKFDQSENTFRNYLAYNVDKLREAKYDALKYFADFFQCDIEDLFDLAAEEEVV